MISPMLYKLAEEIEPSEEESSKEKGSEEKPPKEGESEEKPPKEEGEPVEGESTPAQGSSVDPIVVMDFLASTDQIDDAAFHSFCEQNGYDVDQAEAVAYDLAKRFVLFLRGGKSAGMDIGSVDPQQLEMGMQIESEHADCPSIQKKIALDHLAENPEYYSDPLFQNELQQEHGGEQGVEPQPGEEKQAAMRGQGSCGGKRKFDGSGKGVGKLKKATMTKTARKNMGPFLTMLMKQLKKQSPVIAKKNMANVTRAIKYPSKPVNG